MFIRKVLLVTIAVQTCFIVFVKGQELDTAYLYFDANSDVTCLADIEEDVGNANDKGDIKKYEKTINDHIISFYVCLEMFNFNVREDRADTLHVSYLQQVKFAETEDMIEVIDKREKKIPFSYLNPDSAFEEIYIIEKINNRQVVRYNVLWQYYIE